MDEHIQELQRNSQCFDDGCEDDNSDWQDDLHDALNETTLPQKRCPTCANMVPGHYLPTMSCAVCVIMGPSEVRDAL